MFKSRLSRAARVFVPLLLLALLAAPAVAAGATEGAGAASPVLRAKYLKAVADAQIANFSEISTDLVAIVKGAQPIKLRWEGEPGNSRVLVITWVDGAWYDGHVGSDYALPRFANLWVTVVPELQDFISSFWLVTSPQAPNLGPLTGIKIPDITPLRLEQLLGLPPNAGMSRFVEMWVNPRDLFRPSPDPEVTDHEAELQFPNKLNRFVSFNTSPTILDDGTEYTYPEWFRKRMQTVYSGGDPYPWTRLGYTYDWGDNDWIFSRDIRIEKKPHVGLSEFVVLGGSTVGVKDVNLTEQYIKKHSRRIFD